LELTRFPKLIWYFRDGSTSRLYDERQTNGSRIDYNERIHQRPQPRRRRSQIRLRGSEANHIVVIIDGVEVANPADGAFDFGGLRNEDIIKIEALRGEQSALYGSDAVGGVINIITRAGNTSESWQASVEGGNRNTWEGQISAVIPLGEASLSINGNAFTTEGFDISGLDGERDGAQSRAINLGLNNVELGGITFSGKYGSTIRETDFDSDTDFNGRLDNTNDNTEVTTETTRIDARFSLAGFDHKITARHAPSRKLGG